MSIFRGMLMALALVTTTVWITGCSISINEDKPTKTPSASPTSSPTPTPSYTSASPEPTYVPTLDPDEERVYLFIRDNFGELRRDNRITLAAVRAYSHFNFITFRTKINVSWVSVKRIDKRWRKLDWVHGNVAELERDFHRFNRATYNLNWQVSRWGKDWNDWRFHWRKAKKANRNVKKYERQVLSDFSQMQAEYDINI